MIQSSQGNVAKASYAQVAQETLMTKEQGILIDTIGNFTVREYTLALGKQIGPQNIRAVSRISQGRVCFFLNSKDTVDQLIEKEVKLTIEDQVIPIRPYTSRAKRIIISNVSPIIPTQILLEEFEKLKITLTSQITYLKAGNNEPGYSHIISFRRQAYINPEDVPKLPPSMKINFDDTVYWIYLSTDKLTCFACNEEGHVARYCKNIIDQPENTHQTEVNTTAKDNNNTEGSKKVHTTEIKETSGESSLNSNDLTTNTMLPPRYKRPPPSSASSHTDSTTPISLGDIFLKPKTKKKKNRNQHHSSSSTATASKGIYSVKF